MPLCVKAFVCKSFCCCTLASSRSGRAAVWSPRSWKQGPLFVFARANWVSGLREDIRAGRGNADALARAEGPSLKTSKIRAQKVFPVLFPWPHEKKLFVTRKVLFGRPRSCPSKKHFGLTSPPCLIEQHLLVHSFGPVPSTEAACRCFVRNCADVVLQKERRRSCEKGPLIRRRRALRSDCGTKRKAYRRRKTKCAGEAPNARLLQRDGTASVSLGEAPSNASVPSIFDDHSPRKGGASKKGEWAVMCGRVTGPEILK